MGDFADLGLDRTTVVRDIEELVRAGLFRAGGKVYRLKWKGLRRQRKRASCRIKNSVNSKKATET